MPFFEPLEKMDPKHVDLERARKSLREELEAIDFYQERIDATTDESLKKLLAHNMNEEKEHAAMLIEWIRKNDLVQDKAFKEHD
ncbi:MAG: ferritin [Patescibacteria group bacterium]|nr:ferritin [Patescibacteria group bacterium]